MTRRVPTNEERRKLKTFYPFVNNDDDMSGNCFFARWHCHRPPLTAVDPRHMGDDIDEPQMIC